MNPDKKIRRLQSLLYTSGVGTILFSLWSGIRGIEIIFAALREGRITGDGIIDDRYLNVFAGILAFFLMFCVVGAYVYIGRKAIRTSLGEKTSWKYIVLSVFFVVSSARSYVSAIFTLPPAEWIRDGGMILSLIDFTSLVILAEVAVFSILLKKQR